MAQGIPSFLFTPLTNSQKLARDSFLDNTVSFITGPAGTGKTTVAIGLALRHMFKQNEKIDLFENKKQALIRIVLTRPQVDCGEKMGYLPGTLEEKLGPWLLPVMDAIEGISGNPNEIVKRFVDFSPIGMMRGRSFHNRVVVCDEAQNLTFKQLKMLVTRIGHNSKMIICGDTDQSDLRDSGLAKIIQQLRSLDGIGVTEMPASDCQRSLIVRAMLQRFKECDDREKECANA